MARSPGSSRLSRPVLALLVCAVALSAPAAAQAPLTLVNDSTFVRSLQFDVPSRSGILEADLNLQIATTALPKRYLFFLGGGVKAEHPLQPIELAKDAVRLERFYSRNGFPRARADFEVELDTAANAADVTFVVETGPPRLIGEVQFRGPGQADVLDQLPPELHEPWTAFTRSTTLRTGDRLSDAGRVTLLNQTQGWLLNHGYAFSYVGAEAFPDSTGLVADVRLKITAGPRARVDQIVVQNAAVDTSAAGSNTARLGVPDRIVTRELPFSEGDWFDASGLTEGQREIFGLNLFQLAIVDVAEGQPRDSTVSILVRVRQGPTRVANAFGGYFTEGGVTVRGSLTHRNVFGGAQSLTAGVEARTGIGTIATTPSGDPIRDIQASVSLRQPYVGDRRLSFTTQPLARLRNDEIENSRSVGTTNTLLFTRSALQTVSLSAGGLYRQLVDTQTSLGLVDPTSPTDGLRLKTDSLTSFGVRLGLDASWGVLDNSLQPTRGFILRPSASYTPGVTLAALRGRLAATALYPLSEQFGVVVRATAGALAPLGSTSADRTDEYVLLRDQLFYAGGTSDVRGWSSTRLGPKAFSVIRLPNPDQVDAEGNVLPVDSDSLFIPLDPTDVNYIGVGGRQKVSGSVQLNLPFPGLGQQWGTNVFLDAGRVVSPSTVPGDLLRATGNPADSSLAAVLSLESALRVGTGVGIQFLSPVGFISFAVGYKVNPSALDLRDASDVYCGPDFDPTAGDTTRQTCGGYPLVLAEPGGGYLGARARNEPFDIESIPTGGFLKRIQFHFSIGQTF